LKGVYSKRNWLCEIRGLNLENEDEPAHERFDQKERGPCGDVISRIWLGTPWGAALLRRGQWKAPERNRESQPQPQHQSPFKETKPITKKEKLTSSDGDKKSWGTDGRGTRVKNVFGRRDC